MQANAGGDFFSGHEGPDAINGGNGNDDLKGGPGHDGHGGMSYPGIQDKHGSDTDRLCGGDGDDTLDVDDNDENDSARGNAGTNGIAWDTGDYINLEGICPF